MNKTLLLIFFAIGFIATNYANADSFNFQSSALCVYCKEFFRALNELDGSGTYRLTSDHRKACAMISGGEFTFASLCKDFAEKNYEQITKPGRNLIKTCEDLKLCSRDDSNATQSKK